MKSHFFFGMNFHLSGIFFVMAVLQDSSVGLAFFKMFLAIIYFRAYLATVHVGTVTVIMRIVKKRSESFNPFFALLVFPVVCPIHLRFGFISSIRRHTVDFLANLWVTHGGGVKAATMCGGGGDDGV